MISRIVDFFRGSHAEPESSPNLPISPPPKTCLEQTVMYAYFCYTLLLVLSLALHLFFDEDRMAASIVLIVTGLHFAMGFILSVTGTTSLKRRYEWERSDGTHRASGFRGLVTLLSDFFIMPVALATATLALVRIDEHGTEDQTAGFAYGVAIASATIGNAVCNLLHITD